MTGRLRYRAVRAALLSGVYYVALIALAMPFILPFAWMASTALKPAHMVYVMPPQWIPRPLTLSNFQGAWRLLDLPRLAWNSLVVTMPAVFGTLLSSSLVAYGFAMLPGRAKGLLFTLLLATVMVPASVTLIPLYILFSKLGWVDTYLPLIVPHFFASPFYVFIFRQFFRALPAEIFESAEIDGCNPLLAYWYIGLPLSRPALGTAAIFAFAGAWNDFLGPLVYLSSNGKFTLSLGLSFFHGLYYSQLHYLMPVCLLALVPVLAVFLAAQRFFVQGIVTKGLLP